VRNAIDSIKRELMQALGEDVTRTQKMLDDERDAIVGCDTTKASWKANNDTGHAAYNTFQSQKQTAHEDCRAAEELLCVDATEKCNALTDQVCNWDHCKKPSAASWSNGDTDAVNTYMLCLEGWFQTENTTYRTNKANCLQAVNDWHHKSTDDCDIAQGEFESASCDTEDNVETNCRVYRQCRDRTHASYRIVRRRVEELEDVYQTQRVALHSLECYGERILNNDTDISQCETLSECCSLTDCPYIQYHALPACVACDEPDPTNPSLCDPSVNPDRNAFTNHYYRQFDNSCTPAEQCTPCFGMTFTEGAAQCADWNADWATASQGCPASD